MASSIKLSVILTQRSLDIFRKLGLDIPGEKLLQDCEFKCASPPMTIQHVGWWIEQYLQWLYKERSGGTTKIIAQVLAVWNSRTNEKLDFQNQVGEHLKPSDTVIVEALFLGPVSESFDISQIQPRWSDQELEDFRKGLRFGMNDRVLCNCGPRWLSGHIVGTAVPEDEEEDLLAYLVKTDPLPGLPSATISVPRDSSEICVQDTCFDPNSQLHLVKAATITAPASSKSKLRFALGDKVVCRICNDPQDGLEQWVSGKISETWPKLPGEHKWSMGEVSGNYPDVVPYKIDLVSGWVYCHRDDHTLVRRQGLQPQTRVRGISKRMELLKCADGTRERIDHVTERRKRLQNAVSSDSDE